MPVAIRHALVAALGIAFLATVPISSAAAQQSANAAPPAGAGVTVIIPDSLVNAPRTLSELLRDYAPAAAVQRSTGGIGASAFVSLRDASAVRGDDPLVVIDGIRQVSYRVSLDTLARRAPSILDDIMLDDVARIEILPGVAAAASYGDDGQRGAIVVTTRAPGSGRPVLRASISTSAADDEGGYARNLSRVTATGTPCAYYSEALGYCTATATTRYTPLLDRSPFRAQQQVRAHLGASGGLGSLGYVVALGGERGAGTMAFDAADRTVASLRLRLPVGSLVRIGLASFATERGISFSSQRDYSVLGWGVGGGPLDCSAATPCGADSSSGGYRLPLDWLEQNQPRRRIGHLGSALTVDVDPTPALALQTSVTADMLRDEESLRDSPPPGYGAAGRRITADERNWRVGGAETARLTTRVGAAVATTMLALRADAERGRSEASTAVDAPQGSFPGGTYTTASMGSALFRNRVSTSLDERIAWGEQAAVGFGAIRTTTAFRRSPHPAPTVDPHVDAMYQLVPATAPLGMLGSLRLRAAWAQASGHDERMFSDPRIFAYIRPQPFPIGGGGAEPVPADRPDRSAELEGGFDATFPLASSRLSVTGFRRNETIRKLLPLLAAGRSADAALERKVSGGELVAEATPIEVPAARLHLRAQLAVSRDRVSSTGISWLNMSVAPAVALALADGESWAAWRLQRTGWNDANGNGRIEFNEITASNPTTGGRSRPSRVASLASDLDFARSLTLSAVVDHAGGFDLYDASAAQQCGRGVCAALNDPGASLADQGRAVAMAGGWGGAGFVVPGDATRLREVSLAWRSPRAATLLHATTLRVTLSAYDLASWTRSKGVHPETDAATLGVPSDLRSIVQPVPRTFTLRVALGL